jgi:transketolase
MPNSTKNITAMANAIRALAMDAVQQANSGHPGAPMGMADMAVASVGAPSAPQPGAAAVG